MRRDAATDLGATRTNETSEAVTSQAVTSQAVTSEAVTVDLAESKTAAVVIAGPTTPTEQHLSEVLADVMEVERVSVTSDFFDDLGADSMVMALFCARLRKRADLPSPSIKQVYQHRTVSSLAAAVAVAASTPEPASESESAPIDASPPTAAPTSVRTRQLALLGTIQLLTILGFTFLLGFVIAKGYEWISAGSGFASLYLRLAVFGGALFLGLAIVPILVKWAVVGRWKSTQFRIWGPEYFRFWFVKFFVQLNPLVLFAGTPIYVFYLRALGARIGRGTVVISRSVPVCSDLLTVGDNTIVRKDSVFTCYRAHAGWIQTGPVRIGKDAFVGEATVLDIGTSLGDGAQLGHSSSLHAGQSVPDGEHRVGSPAQQSTEVDYREVLPTERSTQRKVAYSVTQVLFLFAVSLPLLFGLPMVIALPLSPAALQGSEPWPFASATFYGEALIASLVLFIGLSLVGLIFALTIPRALNLAIKPGKAYPLYGVRYWIHRTIGRLTNVPFFTNLLGDTSYILHYLYWLGYDISFEGQTGANFGLNVKHDNPYNVTVGPGTMAADGLSMINIDYSTTSFRVSPVAIGAQSFLGNNVAYPSQGKTGENCLHATKVMVPVEGEVREDTGFLGSPSFEIPRIVLRDRKFDDLKSGPELGPRLAAKNRHNVATMALFLLVRMIPVFAAVLLIWSAVVLDQRLGAWMIIVPLVIAPMFGFTYFILVERASIGFKRLRPLYCSMYDLESWQVERYWKLSWQPIFLNGTPFKGAAWRLMGIRIGKRVFDDGCLMIDKTMITVGDDCVLNSGSVIQPHSQEDGTFKSDYVTIGNGCTLGIGALVHYGVTMGDGATLAADSFLMKGAEVPPHTQWGDNPAREFVGDHRIEAAKTAAVLVGSAAMAQQGSGSTEGRARESASGG